MEERSKGYEDGRLQLVHHLSRKSTPDIHWSINPDLPLTAHCAPCKSVAHQVSDIINGHDALCWSGKVFSIRRGQQRLPHDIVLMPSRFQPSSEKTWWKPPAVVSNLGPSCPCPPW